MSSKPKKKRTKQYNRYKHQDYLIEAAAQDWLVGWAVGKHANTAFTKHGTLIPRPNLRVVQGLQNSKLPWSSLCVVSCRDQSGKEYMQSQMVRISTQKYKHSTIAGKLNDVHQDLISQVNSLHLVSCGWVASPSGQEISDEIADKILTQLGIWERKSDYELEQLEKGHNMGTRND